VSRYLRHLSLPRLALLCIALPALGGAVAAAASAVETGPVPPSRSLAAAIHDSLTGAPVEGLTARIQYTNHLLEGASLASGGAGGAGLASSPLLTGASGRLWIAKDGRVRLELQTDQGSTEVLYANHTLTIYDDSSNTIYRFAPAAAESGSTGTGGATDATGATARAQAPHAGSDHGPPSEARIEEALGRLQRHARVFGPTPTDIAGQPAYTATISPREAGSLIGSVALSWDANHAVPLRAAVYSTQSASPVIELAATEVAYGPVDGSIFTIAPPEGAKVVEPLREHHRGAGAGSGGTTGAGGVSGASGGRTAGEHPHVTRIGNGISTVLALRAPASEGGAKQGSSPVPGTRTVQIGGARAQELQTALGTILTFERSGARYLLAGFVPASTVEAAARGL
jgi:outer membrane lipoprotein-sorting protein